MSYIAPLGGNVILDFAAVYTPDTGSNIILEFGDFLPFIFFMAPQEGA